MKKAPSWIYILKGGFRYYRKAEIRLAGAGPPLPWGRADQE